MGEERRRLSLCMLLVIPEGDRVDKEWNAVEAHFKECGSLEDIEIQDLPPFSVRSTAPFKPFSPMRK